MKQVYNQENRENVIKAIWAIWGHLGTYIFW